jgi:hypothetical protein
MVSASNNGQRGIFVGSKLSPWELIENLEIKDALHSKEQGLQLTSDFLKELKEGHKTTVEKPMWNNMLANS